MMGEEKEFYTIALAGLLHDIGKFLQRAKEKEKDFKFDDNGLNEDLNRWKKEKQKLENEYRYEHAYLSEVFLSFLEKKGIIDSNLKQKLINCGVKHHRPVKSELCSVISRIADWYSASERENILGSELNYMHSIFERISLEPRKNRKGRTILSPEDIPQMERYSGVYKLKPLYPDRETVFPEVFESYFVGLEEEKKENKFQGSCFHKKEDKIPVIKPVKEFNKNLGDYKDIFNNFIKDFLKIKGKDIVENQAFNYIYYLFYKYTWCVPASTFDIEKATRHYPDISLFDHSRVLSAIAVCIYDWAKQNNKEAEDLKITKTENCYNIPTDEEEIFLLLEGDIGGIQSFIYGIHKSSESELSIAKALRGRSFFLSMLPEVFARYILKKFGYPITNILFIGAGKFQILLANTEDNRRKLEEIEKEINRWLFNEFQGELTFSIAYVTFKGKVFRERKISENEKKPSTFLDFIEKLQIEIDKKKKRKLGDLIFEEVPKDTTSAEEICPSCRVMRKIKEFCYWCDMSQKWGSILPKIKYIAFDWGEGNKVELEERKIIDLEQFGRVYLLEKEDLEKVKGLPEILSIEDTELEIKESKVVNGFKFLGHTVPKVSKGVKEALNRIFREKQERKREQEKEELKEGDVIPFEVLVEFAKGDKKLAYIRADVDYLGLIFSDGLRYDEFGEEEIYTISRVAQLSRMLDLFFSGYLNELARKVSYDFVKEELNKLKDKEELSDSEREYKELLETILDEENKKLKIDSLIYIVYSGGDDLFVIAPYDVGLRFVLELRKEFMEYTCRNPDFGISCGIYIGKHNTPIHLVAKFSKGLESKAKDLRKEKDAVAVFGKTFVWSKEIEENAEILGGRGISGCENNNNNNSEKPEKNFMDLETVFKIANMFEKHLEEKNINRAFFYKLLSLHREYVKGDSLNLMIYPKICYYLARNVSDENVRNELRKLLLENRMGNEREFNNHLIVKNIDVPVYIALMRTRKGGGE